MNLSVRFADPLTNTEFHSIRASSCSRIVDKHKLRCGEACESN